MRQRMQERGVMCAYLQVTLMWAQFLLSISFAFCLAAIFYMGKGMYIQSAASAASPPQNNFKL